MRSVATRLQVLTLIVLLAGLVGACGQMGPLSLPEPGVVAGGEDEAGSSTDEDDADDER
jgi:predicted small lipoprotein YifL